MHVREENQTLATITLQNYFRMYDKLAGMTGTAVTEDAEFREIYKLPVMVIPTNQPMVRDDRNDLDLPHRRGEVQRGRRGDRASATRPDSRASSARSRSRTPSSSRACSTKRGIKHNVLNAKYHEQEAHIIAQAGRAGAVTIATNMAGRGTDIILGGNPEFLWEDILARARHQARGGDRGAAGRGARRGQGDHAPRST